MIGAGIAVLTGIGAGFGIGIATSKAAEAIAIYGFVVALLMVIMKQDPSGLLSEPGKALRI